MSNQFEELKNVNKLSKLIKQKVDNYKQTKSNFN